MGWERDDRWLMSMPLGARRGLFGGDAVRGRGLSASWSTRQADSVRPRWWTFAKGSRSRCFRWFQPCFIGCWNTNLNGCPGRLRAVLVGGAATPLALAERAIARQIPILLTYGLSETCSQVASQGRGRLTDPDRARDVGRPLASTDVRVKDQRLEVRGSTLFSGYLAPDSVGRVLAGGPGPSGWFRTSDMGRLDDVGRLVVLGRADDVIVSGGENVLPFTVEESIRACSGVLDVCVVGLPDQEWGEVVAAVCVVSPGVEYGHRTGRVSFATGEL